MKLETWLEKEDFRIFPAPRFAEIFMAVNLIGLALLAKDTLYSAWWFDALLVTAVMQLGSVLIPLVKKIEKIREHLCRMFAALVAIAVAGAYIVTVASGLAAWILALNFISFTTVLAIRLAALVMHNGKPVNMGNGTSDTQRGGGRNSGTHTVLSVPTMAVSPDASEVACRQRRAVTG